MHESGPSTNPAVLSYVCDARDRAQDRIAAARHDLAALFPDRAIGDLEHAVMVTRSEVVKMRASAAQLEPLLPQWASSVDGRDER